MDSYEFLKTMLGNLSEGALQSLHNKVRDIINDSETGVSDHLTLSKHLADLARLLEEKRRLAG